MHGKLLEVYGIKQTQIVGNMAPLAEWRCNSTYHLSVTTIPFMALYGYPTPLLMEQLDLEMPLGG